MQVRAFIPSADWAEETKEAETAMTFSVICFLGVPARAIVDMVAITVATSNSIVL